MSTHLHYLPSTREYEYLEESGDDYSFLDEYASILVDFLDENVCILVKLIRNSKCLFVHQKQIKMAPKMDKFKVFRGNCT